MPPADRWYQHVPAATAVIPCEGEQHRVTWRWGKFKLDDHDLGSERAMLVLGFPLGFFASGIFSGMGAFFTELFPTRVRGSGQGFSYNFGRGVGALFPTVIGFLAASMPLGRAIGIFAASAYALLFVAALMLPETRGRELAAVA